MAGKDEMSDTFRKVYKPLTDIQKSQMEVIKERAEDLLRAIDDVAPAEERSERSRCLAVARTNLEQSIMWAIKGVTA